MNAYIKVQSSILNYSMSYINWLLVIAKAEHNSCQDTLYVAITGYALSIVSILDNMVQCMYYSGVVQYLSCIPSSMAVANINQRSKLWINDRRHRHRCHHHHHHHRSDPPTWRALDWLLYNLHSSKAYSFWHGGNLPGWLIGKSCL